MKITAQTVARMAQLAKLELTEPEQEALLPQLEQVFAHMEVLHTLNMEAVSPMSHVLPVENAVREDEVEESLPVQRLLKSAPTGEQGGFFVPRTVE